MTFGQVTNRCRIDDCGRDHHAHGLCRVHYLRFWRTGDPLHSRSARPAEERFWEKVARGTDEACWPWRGSLVSGYGTFNVGRHKAVKAHRFSYELAKGPVPSGLTIDHLCRNKACVNPRHLEAVSGAENTRRAHTKGYREVPARCKRGHDWTLVPPLTHVTKAGKIKRRCRECALADARRAYAKRAEQVAS